MAEPSATTMRAGVGKVDITCREKGLWADLLAEKVKKHIPPDYLEKPIEISDPCFVRALVLDNGHKQIVLVTMDVTAIGARTISQDILSDSADDFVPKLRKHIEEAFNIPGDHVNVTATHTHQVPRMLCDDDEQIRKTLEAIRQAKQNMVPVTVGVGSGDEKKLTFNRTMMMKDGSDYTVRSYHAPMPPDHEVEGLRPIDPEIGILKIDRLDGQPLAVVYDFACHLLLGGPDGSTGMITADHVGVALKYLEDNIGSGVMAFALQGAVGDAIEACQFDTDHPPTSGDLGTKLGQSILNTYRTITPGSASLAVASRTIELPLRTDIPDVIAQLKQKQQAMAASLRYTSLSFKAFLPLYLKYSLNAAYPSQWAYRYLHANYAGDTSFKALDERNKSAVEKYLQSIRTMERLADIEENIATLQKHQEVIDELGSATITAEFKGIRIGDCVLITAPMEVLSETGLKVKRSSPFANTYIVSLANGYLHYAPPASYYPRGGYEVTECLLDPAWEKMFDTVVEELFDELQASNAPTVFDTAANTR